MKKQNNIQTLKELVNNTISERVELATRGAQAYNIANGEEYAVITEFAKINGRYYFIDRQGRRFLASRYDRAEWLAGEMLEVIENDEAAAKAAADQVKKSGSAYVRASLLSRFFDECDARGVKVESVHTQMDWRGEMYTLYNLKQTEDQEGDELATIPTASLLDQLAKISPRAAWDWLNTPHTFGDDSEAVTLQGWQYLGLSTAVTVLCFFFSIVW